MKEFLRTQSFKNIAVLSSGTIAGQAIPVLLQPVLRRIISVDEFSAYALYSSIIGIITIISSLRYEMTIIQPKHNNEAVNLFFVSLIINLFICLLVFVVICWFKEPLGAILKFPVRYTNWLLFVPVSVFLFGTFRSINFWLIRNKAFRISSYNKIYRRGGEAISQIGLGFSKSNYTLVISEIIGNLVNVGSGIYYLIRTGFKYKLMSIKKMIFVARKYSSYPKHNSIPSLLDIASLQMPILIINHAFTRNDVAQFDLSRMILSISLVLVGTAISQVIQQKVAEDRNNNASIRKEFKSVLSFLCILSLLQIIVIVFLGPMLFSLFFGKEYEIAGKFSQILIFSYTAKFIVSPLSIIFISLEKMSVYSKWQYLYFISILLLFFLDGLTINQFLIVYVLIELVFYSACLYLLSRVINDYENSLTQS